MKPCISQATTLKNPFEADLEIYRAAGWTAVEIWLTKLETFLQSHTLAEAGQLLESNGIKPVAAASQGGLLLSQGPERAVHWDHFRRRLALLRELGVATLIVTPDFVHQPGLEEFAAGGRGARRSRRAGRVVRRADRARVSKVVPLLLVPRDGTGPDRPGGSGQCGRLLRRLPLLHRPEQVRGPRLPVAAEPGVGSALRRERHAPRAGGRRRPDLAGRGRLSARRRSSTIWGDRLRRPRFARGVEPSSLAGCCRSCRRSGPSGSSPRLGPWQSTRTEKAQGGLT